MKKILIITYYWPPSGGAGVQRWLKFAKYLQQTGWLPTVVTTRDGDYPAIDESLLEEIPVEVKVIRTQTPTFSKFFLKVGKNKVPYGNLEINSSDSLFKKLAIWCRLNLVVPDARKVWNKYALKAVFKELGVSKYSVVITSGPPHSTHLVGLKLKKKYNFNWLADFRDPWTTIDYLEKVKRLSFTERQDKILENKVVENCDKIISISQKILDDLNVSKKGIVIPNGFDPEDFIGLENQKTEKFEINYFGSIIQERDPSNVLNAVNQLTDIKQEIIINIWGNISQNVKAKLISLDRNRIINFQDYIPHNKMLKKMVNSSILLLIINDVSDNKGIFTGKIFEYLGAKVPVLGIGPVDGKAAEILSDTKAGQMFNYSDLSGITKFIKAQYENWNKGVEFKASKEMYKYSRKKQTEELARELNKL